MNNETIVTMSIRAGGLFRFIIWAHFLMSFKMKLLQLKCGPLGDGQMRAGASRIGVITGL